MRVGFPFLKSDIGPSIFLRNLKREINSQNLIKTSNYLNPFCDFHIHNSLPKKVFNKPYISRVDGIYIDNSLSDEEISNRNSPIINGLLESSGIIYQSEFSKTVINKAYEIPEKPSKVILNGTNLDRFKSSVLSNKREELDIKNDDLVFISSAFWRSGKRLKHMIDLFIKFRSIYTEKKAYFIILGEIHDSYQSNKKDMAYLYNELEKNDDIIHLGHIKHDDLPQWYSIADIFLFLSLCESCPNSVVEAIASKLPVICCNVGGTSELVRACNAGIVVDEKEEFLYERVNFSEPPIPNYEKLLDSMIEISKNLDEYKSNINTRVIDIKYTAERYVDFMKNVFSIKT